MIEHLRKASNSPDGNQFEQALHDVTIKTEGNKLGSSSSHFKHSSVSTSAVRVAGDFKFGDRNASGMNVYEGPNHDILSHPSKNSRSHSSMMKIRNNNKQTSLISKRASAASAMHSAANMPALMQRS